MYFTIEKSDQGILYVTLEKSYQGRLYVFYYREE